MIMRLSHRQIQTTVFISIIFVGILGLVLIGGVPISANRLEVSIEPEKKQYSLGEEVNVSFYLTNTLWFPVRFPVYTRIRIGGTIDGQRVKGSGDIHATPVRSTILIPSGRRHYIWNSTFVPEHKGVMRIEIIISGPKLFLRGAEEVNIS